MNHTHHLPVDRADVRESIAMPFVVADPELEPAVTPPDLLEDLVGVEHLGRLYLAEHNVIDIDLLWPPHGDVRAQIVGAHIGE